MGQIFGKGGKIDKNRGKFCVHDFVHLESPWNEKGIQLF